MPQGKYVASRYDALRRRRDAPGRGSHERGSSPRRSSVVDPGSAQRRDAPGRGSYGRGSSPRAN